MAYRRRSACTQSHLRSQLKCIVASQIKDAVQSSAEAALKALEKKQTVLEKMGKARHFLDAVSFLKDYIGDVRCHPFASCLPLLTSYVLASPRCEGRSGSF